MMRHMTDGMDRVTGGTEMLAKTSSSMRQYLNLKTTSILKQSE
jgi:hypothetical protein